MHTPGSSVSGYALLLIVQIVFIIVFGFCTDYAKELLPVKNETAKVELGESNLRKYPRKNPGKPTVASTDDDARNTGEMVWFT